MTPFYDPSGETIVVRIRVKKHELAECLRRIPKDGTLHDSVYGAFSFGLFVAYELEGENRELLRKLVEAWREPGRQANDARLIGETDDELLDRLFGVANTGPQTPA